MSAIEKIDFHGDTLFAKRQDVGPPLVAVKPVIERLGIDWPSQLKRIKRNELLSEGVVMMTTPSPGGDQDSVALPLNLIPGFLFGIESSRIADPDAKALVLAYQRECHDVLYQHFFGPKKSAEFVDPLNEINTKARLVEIAIKLGGKPAGRKAWLELGLPDIPEINGTVTKPSASSSRGMDFVQKFLNECTQEAPGGRVEASELFRRFGEWAIKNDAPSMTISGFGRSCTALGLEKSKASTIHYVGIRILHLSEVEL